MITQDNPVKYSLQLARAVEIAALGGLKILVAANTENYKKAKEDFIYIRSLYSAISGHTFVPEKPHINIELTKPDFLNTEYESLTDIQKRIVNAKTNPKVSDDICSTSESFLKNAYERLDLGIVDVLQIKEVAATIARLEGASKIEVQHLAEAVQYKAIDLENLEVLS